MSYTTYFEIGGQVIETYVEGHHHHAPLRPRADPLHHYMKEEHGVSKSMTRAALKQASPEGYDLNRASRGAGRARRARWALSLAGTLAMADGPLPIGDVLAIGFLGVYGAYEGTQAYHDIRQK